MKDVARLKKRFQEQLGFLASSAAAYDQGIKAEAIRLAGVMRVLFSHSRKSAGLVFQLGGKRILLDSTCPKFPIEPIQFSGIVDFVFKEGQTEGEAIAPLDGSITPEGKYLTSVGGASQTHSAESPPHFRTFTGIWSGRKIWLDQQPKSRTTTAAFRIGFLAAYEPSLRD